MAIQPQRGFLPKLGRPVSGFSGTVAPVGSITVANGLVTDVKAGASTTSGGSGGGGGSTGTGIEVTDGVNVVDPATSLMFSSGTVGQVADGQATYTPPSPALQALVGTVNGSNKTFTLPVTTYSGYFLVSDGIFLYPGIDYTVSGSAITVTGQAPQGWIAMSGW